MNNRKYVFSQLLDFLDRNHFNYLVRKYEGDKNVKQFTYYNQLAVLMFGQLSSRESLRNVVLAIQAHAAKAYHLGFGKATRKSNLSKVNNNRERACNIHEQNLETQRIDDGYPLQFCSQAASYLHAKYHVSAFVLLESDSLLTQEKKAERGLPDTCSLFLPSVYCLFENPAIAQCHHVGHRKHNANP